MTEVTMQDMEDAIQSLEKEGVKNPKVVICPKWKGIKV